MPIINEAFKSLEDKFKPIVLEILTKLEAKGYNCKVIEGRRTVAQQREKVNKGYSKTMNSYHLTGNACDICDVTEMWDKGLVRPFWWDMYQIVKDIKVDSGRLRSGIVWDVSSRADIYKKALDDLQAGKITQKQADAKITWFSDCAHTEMRS